MDEAILKGFCDSGERVHIVFRANTDEIRWHNGVIERVAEDSILLRTFRDESIGLCSRDVIRVEKWRPPPQGREPGNDSWREVYKSHGVDADFEEEGNARTR